MLWVCTITLYVSSKFLGPLGHQFRGLQLNQNLVNVMKLQQINFGMCDCAQPMTDSLAEPYICFGVLSKSPIVQFFLDFFSQRNRNRIRYLVDTIVGRSLYKIIWLSPTGDPNPKWVSNRIPIASNRVPIQKTHFGCQERYNSNLSILSLEDPFA